MKAQRYLWPIAIQLIFASCRIGADKHYSAIPPMPRQGELDSSFYMKSLGMTAIVSIQSNPDGAVVSLEMIKELTTQRPRRTHSGKHPDRTHHLVEKIRRGSVFPINLLLANG
jgi:hypothetical protein